MLSQDFLQIRFKLSQQIRLIEEYIKLLLLQGKFYQVAICTVRQRINWSTKSRGQLGLDLSLE